MHIRASTVEISPALLAEVESHAEETYPEECCGVLFGIAVETVLAAITTVRAVRPTQNAADPAAKSSRYLIGPEELLEVYKEARSQGLDVIGYYHSHPGEAAAPSARDLAEALPGVSYLIVSVGESGVGERRSWRLRMGSSRFDEERIV